MIGMQYCDDHKRDLMPGEECVECLRAQLSAIIAERDGLKAEIESIKKLLGTGKSSPVIADVGILVGDIDKLRAEVEAHRSNSHGVAEKLLQERQDRRIDALVLNDKIALKDRQIAVARAALLAIWNNSSDGYIDPTLTDSSEKVEDYASYTLAAIEALEGSEDALAAITSLEKTAGTEGGADV